MHTHISMLTYIRTYTTFIILIYVTSIDTYIHTYIVFKIKL